MRKNIYVREEDLPIFEKAEQLGGDNMSAVIAQALRNYVEKKEAEQQGMKEIELKVGIFRPAGADDSRTIRLTGRLLAEGRVFTGQTSDKRDRGADYEIYQTQKGKIVAFWRHWSLWERENDVADYAVIDELPKPGRPVIGKEFDDPVLIPGEILQEAAEQLGQELVEYID